MKILIVLSFFATAVLCNPPNSTFVELEIYPEEMGRSILMKGIQSGSRGSRIVLGDAAGANQFPYFSYIVIYRSSTSIFCGGSLISQLWVLTAAHCMNDIKAAQVYFGSTDKTKMKISQSAKGFFIHPSYNSPSYLANDIGILKLVAPVPLSTSVKVIQLPTRSDTSKSFKGVLMFVSGFGKTTTGYPQNLHFTKIVGFSDAECLAAHWVFTNEMLCGVGAFDEGSSVCSGDSGKFKGKS